MYRPKKGFFYLRFGTRWCIINPIVRVLMIRRKANMGQDM